MELGDCMQVGRSSRWPEALQLGMVREEPVGDVGWILADGIDKPGQHGGCTLEEKGMGAMSALAIGILQ